ncbi:BQ5605_C026g10203 [Microbotryum silenes-dioicae]|uniref:BQ5605_C026g10203 protein n=1 Tax=Microbotryum silenes-dioicae TaxID=796604 RepID=A0A2X0PM30_9BASI|nr:BQ5605_C026g10203 [Microbotryum silenes-dioicae]
MMQASTICAGNDLVITGRNCFGSHVMSQSNWSVSHDALRLAFERLAHTCQHDGQSTKPSC